MSINMPGHRYDGGREKEEILSQFSQDDIDAVELIGSRVLVAKWIRKKVGSIILSTKTQVEDGFQGKVGLVLKTGPLAFQDDGSHDWRGQAANPGDWVVFNYSSGSDFDHYPAGSAEPVRCKILDESEIQMIVQRPDFAY